jgi:hypothetical protein
MRRLKGNDCIVILIIFLKKLTIHSPSNGVFIILLDLSFKAEDRLLNLTLFNELSSFGHQICLFHIFVVLLKLNCSINRLPKHSAHLAILLPYFVPLAHHIHAFSWFISFLFPLLHHLFKLVLR